MDQGSDTSQQDKSGTVGTEKIDKLQKELDDLEKRTHEELSKPKPHFSVVEEDEKKDLKEESRQPEENVSSISEDPREAADVKNEEIKGKIISSQVVEEPKPQEQQPTTLTQNQESEVMQVQPNESGEKPKEPVDTNKMTKSIFWIALVLFLITLSAVGAYFVGSRNAPATGTPTPTPLAVNTPTPTPEEPPSIVSFLNEIYKYSFNYPGTMQLMKDLSSPDDVVAVTENENSFIVYAGAEDFTPVAGADPVSETEYVISGVTTTREVYAELYEVYVFPENESEINDIVIRYKDGAMTTDYETVMSQILASFTIPQSEVSVVSPSPTPTSSPSASPSSAPIPEGGV